MKGKKTAWIICMLGLCVALYTIVISRMDRTENVILGGTDGAFVNSDSVTFIDLNAVETPEPTVDIWPKIDITLPQYRMVNDKNPLPSTFQPDAEKISITNYMMFDASALPYLEAMIEDMQNAGFNVYVAGAYRSFSFQEQLFNGKATQIAMGEYQTTDYMDPQYQKAVEEARTITAFPGCSEHQLGLAVDLMDKSYAPLVYSNMNQEFFEYLDSICADYGFIKRYPTRKLLLTGWDEPWHYRYVGQEAAKFIMENGLCYEEFYAHYVSGFEY